MLLFFVVCLFVFARSRSSTVEHRGFFFIIIIIMGKLQKDIVLHFKHFVLENFCHTGRIILKLKRYYRIKHFILEPFDNMYFNIPAFH